LQNVLTEYKFFGSEGRAAKIWNQNCYVHMMIRMWEIVV